MNATISLNSVTLADVPFNGLGHVAVSGGRKPIAHQRARFTDPPEVPFAVDQQVAVAFAA